MPGQNSTCNLTAGFWTRIGISLSQAGFYQLLYSSSTILNFRIAEGASLEPGPSPLEEPQKQSLRR